MEMNKGVVIIVIIGCKFPISAVNNSPEEAEVLSGKRVYGMLF